MTNRLPPQDPQPRPKLIVVSYWPLIQGTAGAVAKPEVLQDLIAAAGEDTPAVHGCLWSYWPEPRPELWPDLPVAPNTVFPTLIVNRGHEVSEHLMHWSDYDPSAWFRLIIATKGHRYAIALMPDHQKSIERWRYAYRLNTGHDVPDGEIQIISNPLSVVSTISNSFAMLTPVGTDIPVGIADADAITGKELRDIADEDIHIIGNITHTDPGPSQAWIDHLLLHENNDDRPPFRFSVN